MYVPWRRVASWHCSACGECCRIYRPKLTAYEYLKLLPTGLVEERAGKFYIRKITGKCPFQIGKLCSLQTSIKPLSCKMFPFAIYRRGEEEALFEFEKEEFYVYADVFCPNLVLKDDLSASQEVQKLVEEAVSLYIGKLDFKMLTADLKAAKLQQPRLHLARV